MNPLGKPEAPIYVVCEPPQSDYNTKYPTSFNSLKLFLDSAKGVGLSPQDFYFIPLCPPIPEDIKTSKSKVWKFVEPYAKEIQESLKDSDKLIVTMGDLATRTVVGRQVKITQMRGKLEGNIYPILSAAYAFKVPEHQPLFRSDIHTLKKIKDNNFTDLGIYQNTKNYYWCLDLSEILALPGGIHSIDTETTGLDWTSSATRILTLQIGYGNGNVAVVPLNQDFWPFEFGQLERLKEQVAQYLSDKKFRKVGHNINYDLHILEKEGYEVKGVLSDTQMLAWGVDENMMLKDLNTCIRLFVPEMSGYNDENEQHIDKSDMLNLDKDRFLDYAGGDADATLRLYDSLMQRLRTETKHSRIITRIKMPALFAMRQVEKNGILIDRDELNKLTQEVKVDLDRLEEELLNLCPRKVIRKHLDSKKEIKLSRDALIRDILFTEDGFNLKPFVFTNGTKNLQNDKDKIPSVSVKDHMPFFVNEAGPAGLFVNKFIEYSKTEKMFSTYTANFDKYIKEDGKIHSSLLLTRTNTGRLSSSGPNIQNFPSRGKWAKPFKKILKASTGYKFISADLSQIELRLIAIASRDPVMLKAYRMGQDLHALTAARSMGITLEQFNRLPNDERKLARYRAKAVNFGFCFSMRHKKFRIYAKTDYGIDYTEREALNMYNIYHDTYKRIKVWHEEKIDEVNRTGKVVSYLGRSRHLPSVYSPDKMIKMAAERQAINAPIQGDAAELGIYAILRILRQCDPEIIRCVNFIHDDIILEVKDGYEQEGLSALLYAMQSQPLQDIFGVTLPIPIIAEPDIGYNLGEMYPLLEIDKDTPAWVTDLNLDTTCVKPTWWDDRKDIL